jgi:hypothetical protein
MGTERCLGLNVLWLQVPDEGSAKDALRLVISAASGNRVH